jgi:MmeI, C-terminal domain/MmeI, target recognition domain
MAWVRSISGRLKSDPRYSIGLAYNPFPWPDMDESALSDIQKLAGEVLIARKTHPNATLADLYDPTTMPPELRKVHQALDTAVDRLYRKDPFLSDRQRVEFLLALYEKERSPLVAAAAKSPRRKKSAAAPIATA